MSSLGILALVGLSLGLAFGLHLLIWRTAKGSMLGAYRLLVSLFAAGFAVGTLGHFSLVPELSWTIWLSYFTYALAYWGLSTTYVFSYLGIEHESPSSRILLALHRSETGVLRSRLIEGTPEQDAATVRTETMFATGWIRRMGGRIVLTPKGRLAAAFFSIPSHWVRHCGGGRG